MAYRLIPLALLGLARLTAALPTQGNTLLDLEVADDTHSVGSYIREVRAAPPDYHRSYENEGDGELGFSRKKSGGGKKGYQHFDSFHKKAGDHYEFEKQDSYGQDEAAKAGGTGHHHHHADHEGEYSHRHEKKEKYRGEEPSEKYREEEREEPSEEYRDEQSEQYKDNRDKPSKDEVENIEGDDGAAHGLDSQGLKKGAHDGNGGLEAYGHDKADYVLPEKYTYGEGDEYNF